MRIADTSTPVVALKLFSHCGVDMMRTLGRMGVSVHGIDANPGNPAFRSRYCRGRSTWDAERAPAERTIEFLRDAGEKIGGRPVLITNGDVISLFLTDHAAQLSDVFRFRTPNGSLARQLSDKWQMFALAKQHGVPTAETFLPQSRREVEEFLASGRARFPVMLKGANSALLEERTGLRMLVVRDERELLQKYDEMEDPAQPNLMLQEYIPGSDDSIWMFDGYFNEGSDCLLGIIGRKLRQYPVYTGMTSLGVLLRNDPVLETTKRFLKTVGYQGIVDLGYRFDARDGQYKLLDVNPRIGATFRLFADQNGMDVLRAYYLDLTGQPVPAAPVSEGRKWVVENNDLLAFRQYRKDKKITFWKWIRSFRGVQEGAWFAWDDPVPFCLMLKGLLAHFLRFLLPKRAENASGGRQKSPRAARSV
jgi:predicted ATP-grasp superfamily ATP-dependent carboligase